MCSKRSCMPWPVSVMMVRRASGFLAAPCKWSMECSAAGEWAAWGEGMTTPWHFPPLRARVFVASAVPQRKVFAASAAVFAASATQVKVSFVQSKPPSGKTKEPGECALPCQARISLRLLLWTPPLDPRCSPKQPQDRYEERRRGARHHHAASVSGSFITRRRKPANCFQVFIGLVKKSAMLFSVGT